MDATASAPTVEHTPPLMMELALGGTMAVGLVLNAAAARAYARRRPAVRTLALAWCACDLFLLLGTPLLIVTMHSGSWLAGDFLCRLYMAATTLHQWAGAWLLTITVSFLLPFTMGRLESWTLILPLALFILAPTVLIFIYTELYEMNTSSFHCRLGIASYSDHLWISLVGYIFSYHTPITIALCILCIVFKLGRDKEYPGPWKRVVCLQVGLLVAYSLLWLPHWVTQLRLLLLDDDTEPDPVIAHLLAGLLTQINAAVAVPGLLLSLGHQTVGLSRQTSTQRRRDSEDVILSPTNNVVVNDGDSQEGLLLDADSRRSSFNTVVVCNLNSNIDKCSN